ncbi:YhgE/Pip domain-containing protein [Paenibacillus sp. HN-1]|uniref:YhgE/Pip domain-containing protein n=1 Tax=Paenibacillus TaxID=44249 RepID=UPI001CA94BAA|nr:MULTISPECIES: YhgE/Pip domain-containing protein [Paenibacillus]MBY9080625.1 YhgE/Pip domain-containing protein [Paenibacillus sp. CGMCC 1.18879]MBY9085430.1 YhgE/Pip domain-containing protein [Paenibacillus sinensis]
MSKIIQIYAGDWRRVFKAPMAALLIAALIVLPSVYDWVNVAAVWDPYTNTSGIPIAVASLDKGATARDMSFNIGDEVIESLRNNTSLGWRFVSAQEAAEGVRNGRYYASIVIPANFSARLAGMLEGRYIKPELIYTVNEKINAIAPKITAKGASSVTSQIDRNFTETVSGTILSVLKRAGKEFQSELPVIRRVEQGLFTLEGRLPEIEKAGKMIIKLESKLPEMKRIAEAAAGLKDKLPDAERAASELLRLEERWPTLEGIAGELPSLQDRLTQIGQASELVTELDRHFAKVSVDLDEAEKVLAATAAGIAEAQKKLPEAETSGTAEAAEGQGSPQQMSLSEGAQDNAAALDVLDRASSSTEAGLAGLKELRPRVQAVEAVIHDAAERIALQKSELEPLLTEALPAIREGLPAAGEKIRAAAEFASKELPAVKEWPGVIASILPKAEQGIRRAADISRNDLPGLENAVRRAASTVRQIKGEVNLDEIAQLLGGDIRTQSDFLADPVELKEENLFPIPNYGSAMTPFYLVLSLWVGGTLMVALLKTGVSDRGKAYKPYQIFLGRLLTFLSVGLLQALTASLGNLFILHGYAADKLWFVLFAMLVSLVFVTIVYALVSVFGNIGKGIAIVFMVLQFSSSGGTFPVSTAGPFFQMLHPFMPFTYAVGLMREAVGGIQPDAAVTDALRLAAFAPAALVLGLLLKKPLERYIRAAAEKAEASELIS